MRWIPVFCILLLGFSSTAQLFSPKDWTKYHENRFTFCYPDSLEFTDSTNNGTEFMLFWSATNPKDIFRENINLIIQDFSDLEGVVDLKSYTELTVQQIESLLKDGKVLENEQVSINGRIYQRLIYSGTHGIYHFKWLQYFCVEEKKAYLLTFTSEEAYFDELLPLADKIMLTFDFR